MNYVIRHAFLSPDHNGWHLWTSTGNRLVTNEGISHRALESLVYAIDQLAKENWFVKNVFVETGNPCLVLMERRESVDDEKE